MNILKKSFCFTLIIFCTGLAFGATIKNYTADQVEILSNQVLSKVYAADTKFRLDSLDGSGDVETFYIVRLDQKKVYALDVMKRIYTEYPIEEDDKTFYDHITSAQQSAQQITGGTFELKREKTGTAETVLGYRAEKYSVTITDELFGQKLSGIVYYWWLAPEFDMPLRVQVQTLVYEVTFELRNIKTAEPPASLFEIPPGYTKVENSQFQ